MATNSYHEQLTPYLGLPLLNYAVVWYEPWDEMHVSSPLVLEFPNAHLSLCGYHPTEVSLDVEPVDFSTTPFASTPSSAQVHWEHLRPRLLLPLLNLPLRSIHVAMWESQVEGIALCFDHAFLNFFNQGDEIDISLSPLKTTKDFSWIDITEGERQRRGET